MNGINKVIQRINSIEAKFQAKPAMHTPDHFSSILKNAQETPFTPQQTNEVARSVEQAAVRHGVDPKLALAVAATESAFDPTATSSAGAAGVMQLMPDTAKTLGVKNIYNTQENIDGGVRYLKQMLSSFQGDVTKALAAYNAGPEAVRKYEGVPPYPETQDYVAKVIAKIEK